MHHELLSSTKNSVVALIQTGDCMTLLAYLTQSQEMFFGAIKMFKGVLVSKNVSDKHFKKVAKRVIAFSLIGRHFKVAIDIQYMYISRFPTAVDEVIKLGELYIANGNLYAAKDAFEKAYAIDKFNDVTLVNLGYIIINEAATKRKKSLDYLEYLRYGADLMMRGIENKIPQVTDGLYYKTLADALLTLGKKFLSEEMYEKAENKKLIRSFFQRPRIYTTDVKSRPIWNLRQSGIESFFRQVARKWRHIREEALDIVERKLFSTQTDSSRVLDTGKWQAYILYKSGKRQIRECSYAPITCRMFSNITQITNNSFGSVKFSLMQSGTHVVSHSASTNFRIRSHLGLDIPHEKIARSGANSLSKIRIANEYLRWENGQLIVFDDSFEHEVWHYDSQNRSRLILIVDIIHPELVDKQIVLL